MSAPTFEPQAIRRWCRSLTANLPLQSIERNGSPYLTRYFAAGWNPLNRNAESAIYLHRFVASDAADAVHSHPWDWGASLILTGGYREHRCDARGRASVRVYQPGDLNILDARDRHRVELLDGECWTLFLAGRYRQPWYFYPPC